MNCPYFKRSKYTFIYFAFFFIAPPKAELDAKLQGDVVTVRAGSDLVLEASIGGKPEPKVFWSKGDRELDPSEKVALQYTSKHAVAIIKFCDRSDTGKYTLTVKNASGTKQVAVLVKVLGEYFISASFLWLFNFFPLKFHFEIKEFLSLQ